MFSSRHILLPLHAILACASLTPAALAQGTPPGEQEQYTPSLQELLASPQPAAHIVRPESTPSLEDLVKGLQSATWHRFPSGPGAVAVGRANYTSFDNPTATRISKRLAYLNAYINAKVDLAQLLKESFIQAEQGRYEDLALATTGDEDVGNSVARFREQYTQVMRGILRGFVVFDVDDDALGTIRVSIFSTPKTRSIVSHTTEHALYSRTFSDGVAVLMNDLRLGVAPPIGGKIVTIPNTNEIAVIGYGSAVIRRSDEPGLQSAMRTAAERAASLRARTSLLSLLQGESYVWSLTTAEETAQYIQQYEQLEDPQVLGEVTEIEEKSPLRRVGDAAADVAEAAAGAITGKGESDSAQTGAEPLSEAEIENALFTPPTASIRVFDEARRYFRSDFRQDERFESVVKGQLPAGVLPMSWVDEEGGTVYSVAVYTATFSELARIANIEMESGQVLTSGSGDSSGHMLDPSKGFKSVGPGDQPSKDVKKGPTGTVTESGDG